MTSTRSALHRTIEDSEICWPQDPVSDGPNVLLVVLDDVGFAQLGCYGSRIRTPHLDALAGDGVQLSNFHANPMCSPTRASLLTGRNAHAVGFGHIVERAAGYPGYNARLPDTAAALPRLLGDAGYATRAIGKWHLAPSYETGPSGPFHRWPLGRGFDRFYGFLGASTDQYEPELYRDNSPATRPSGGGYHLTEDLVREAISQVDELSGVAPNRPFFLYLALGAAHTPHQVPSGCVEQYAGLFDHGWDVERELVLEHQRDLGIVPETAALPPSNPGVVPWADLDQDERRLFARMMEVYAGFVSHTDAQIGRLVDHLSATGHLENTLVVVLSDNGASAEGGPEGSLDEGLNLNDLPQRASDALEHLDELGGPAFYNHYPWGWAQAGNTPFRWYKQFTHLGGVRTPCLIRPPADVACRPGLREQFHHVTDIAATILELAGIPWPEQVGGTTQMPVDGTSVGYLLDNPTAPSGRRAQYFETYGNRAMYMDNWSAVARLQPDAPGANSAEIPEHDLDDVPWELYDHSEDPTQLRDVAAENPLVLRRLQDEWWAAAGRYQVLPVDVRSRSQRWPSQPRPGGAPDWRWTFAGRCGPYERGVAPPIAGHSFTMTADLADVGTSVEGVIYALGGRHGGYCWYLKDQMLVFEVNLMSVTRHEVSAPVTLEPGRDHTLGLEVVTAPDLSAVVRLHADGRALVEHQVERVLKVAPIGSGRTSTGHDASSGVSENYQSPFPLIGAHLRLQVAPGAPAHDRPEAAEEGAFVRGQ